MKRLLRVAAKLYRHSPFYPHWYEFRTADKLFENFLSEVGNYLRIENATDLTLVEVGCSSQGRKADLFRHLPLKLYVGLDYPTWFQENINSFFDAAKKFGIFKEILFGGNLELVTDVFGDAHNLPFGDESVDVLFHHGAVEHFRDYDRFFSETARCLKSGGVTIFSAPFMYQDHSNYDIIRLTLQGTREALERHRMTEVCYYSTGIGPTISQLINSFIIRHVVRIYSAGLPRVVPLGILSSLFIFPLTNLTGMALDAFSVDERFSSRYYFCFRKS